MAGFVFPKAGELVSAGSLKTPYATGLLKLIKAPMVLAPEMTAADLAANEADFTGYTAKTLTTLPAAFVDAVNGGCSFEIPTQQWDVGSTPTVGNDIHGGWIEDASGNLLMAYTFQSAFAMREHGQSLPVNILINFFGNEEVKVNVAGQQV